jgi:glucosamine--fructose-6-phosphate aminotransferase (isomerizing)
MPGAPAREEGLMCGIVGYVGSRAPVPLLLEGLRHLEYRGYDSAGVAVVSGGAIHSVRAEGKLQQLVAKLEGSPLGGDYGLGHTRWATHGRPSERNAHPILDSRARVAVIHNGIIENFAALRDELRAAGWEFSSETDTEVVANLISAELENAPDLVTAVRRATPRLEGHYAFAALSTAKGDDEIVVARKGPPLVLGSVAGEQFLASDPTALLRHTRDVIFLENGDVARLDRRGIAIFDAAGAAVTRAPRHLSWDPLATEKGGYRHFMLKEIHEQPQAVRATLAGRVRFDEGRVDLAETGLGRERSPASSDSSSSPAAPPGTRR